MNAQNVPINSNQSNSPALEKQENQKVQRDVQSKRAKPFPSQTEVFELNVNHLQSELKSISLSPYRKTPTAEQQQNMELQLKEIARINNNSFEYHLLNYQVGNYDFSKIESLEKAAFIRPNSAEVLKEFSAYFYITDREEKLNQYLKSLHSMRVFPMNLDLFAVNLLKSLPANTILISHGENDTYPLLIQQKIKNIRNDVEIISLEHLQSVEYRKRLKKRGFKIPNNNIIGTDFFIEFIEMNKNQQIIAAPSMPKEYLSKGKTINTIGLGYSLTGFSDVKFDIKQYEEVLKSLITQHVNQGGRSEVLSNYLPFLFNVRNVYLKKMDVQSIHEIEDLMLQIAKLSNKQIQVEALLNK
ncbi:hypothetical protein DIT68_03740 [Brumimicrobium oceani]|uniref:Uncharacterized protein n=1 Tax=Brumimicrobium oceani TaxID=2100725 RepID=A0A2U2XF22_9FLAO|nr:hypothetical protein DIT68_03740 [Brumimicrobium oceani]